MLGFIRKILRFWAQNQDDEQPLSTSSGDEIRPELEMNLAYLREQLGRSPDVIIRRFTLGGPGKIGATLVFIDGLTDKTIINQDILRPLMIEKEKNPVKSGDGSIIEKLEECLVTTGEIQRTSDCADLIGSILAGSIALLLEGQREALIISAPGWETRAIDEPDTEVVVKGPRDGFVETLRTNTALLRRRISHPGLTFIPLQVGRHTKTKLNIAYIKGIAKDELVEEVKRRLQRIRTDGVLAAGMIEQYIEDAPYSPFPTVGWTERPDVVAARLLEGRVAIFTDGSPVVNTVPMLFIENFQSPDDYNFRPYFSTTVRWLRYLAFTMSILSPPLFVALTTYHQELLPTPLLISVAAAVEGTPFPTVVEVIGMGVVFEILREAGIRLPRAVGQAVSIVGALVIGEATVSAGLIGAPTVIVIAFTAIASFVVPYQNEAAIMLRLLLTILSGMFGAFGIICGLLLVLIHLASLRSFGAPYLAPVAPLFFSVLKDVLLRFPLWAMARRPKAIEPADDRRRPVQPPEPPKVDWKRKKK
ncbi:MAG TPA: spore germination protein [Bacillota bacterium]|jgi:spore germination protein KA|nr:spore germination protein [Bacillota bacterium]